MDKSLLYWCDLYKKLKYQARCIDIEVTSIKGPISVIGIYQPREGLVTCDSLVKGKDLTAENLRDSFRGCKLLITFNGNSFDIPRIKREFPGVIPDVPKLDLYLVAKKLNLNAGLKLLEGQFNIFRSDLVADKTRIAVKLWKKYMRTRDERALNMLIEYNKQDAVNLHPLAEHLIENCTERKNIATLIYSFTRSLLGGHV